jgi:uncharacterized protein YqgC (DUF456 family)
MAEKWMVRLVFIVLLLFALVCLVAPHIPAIASD